MTGNINSATSHQCQIVSISFKVCAFFNFGHCALSFVCLHFLFFLLAVIEPVNAFFNFGDFLAVIANAFFNVGLDFHRSWPLIIASVTPHHRLAKLAPHHRFCDLMVPLGWCELLASFDFFVQFSQIAGPSNLFTAWPVSVIV